MLTASLFLLIFAYALSCTMLGPLIPSLRAEYGLSLSQSGLMTALQGVGGVLSLFTGILFADALKRSSLIVTTFFVYCLSVLLVVLLPYYQALLALFFLIGASTRLLESVVNAYVSDLHPEHRGFYLLLLHAFFGVGALLGPVVSTVVLYAGMHWSKIFVGLAALCVLVLLVYLAAEAKSKRGAGRMEVTSLPVLVALLRSRQVWVLCLLSMLYVGFANGLSIWIPSYVRETFHLRDFWGSFPVTALWMGIISGRVSYSFLSLRFRVRPLLLMSNAAAAAVSVAMMVVNTYLALSVGLALAGFLVGATNPLAISLLNEMFPKNRGAVTSAVTFTGALGLMTIPWLAGVVAEWAGFFWGLVVLGACPCGLMLLSLVLLFSGGGRLDPAVLGGTRS